MFLIRLSMPPIVSFAIFLPKSPAFFAPVLDAIAAWIALMAKPASILPASLSFMTSVTLLPVIFESSL